MNMNEHKSSLIDEIKIIGFINALKDIGAEFRRNNDSMVFSKNGYVLVVDDDHLHDDYLGAIMTRYVYDKLCLAYEEKMCELIPFNLSMAQFAWAYGWGHDFREDRMDAENTFEYIFSSESAPYKNVNRIGRFNGDALFMVREYADEKPNGEFGVDDHYYLVGAFNSLGKAMDVACEARLENRSIDIVPVIMNAVYVDDEKPWLGGGWWIE